MTEKKDKTTNVKKKNIIDVYVTQIVGNYPM